MSSPLVIVISGPGGVGKGTVVDVLVAEHLELRLSRSWTTRRQRLGEADDAYTFVDEAAFLANVNAAGFLEWNHFLGVAYYGSPVPDEDSTQDLILEIDVNGARQVFERGIQSLYVFIDAPSLEDQRTRLIGRGDSAEEVDRRMTAGQVERDKAASLPYRYVVNDDVNRAAAEVAKLISSFGVSGVGEASC
jgi:guanylate kinase